MTGSDAIFTQFWIDDSVRASERTDRVFGGAALLVGRAGLEQAIERAFVPALRGDAQLKFGRVLKRATPGASEQVVVVGRLPSPRFVGVAAPWSYTREKDLEFVATSDRLIVSKGTSFVSYSLEGARLDHELDREEGSENLTLETPDGHLQWSVRVPSREAYDPRRLRSTALEAAQRYRYQKLVKSSEPWEPLDEANLLLWFRPGVGNMRTLKDFEAVWAFLLAATGEVRGDERQDGSDSDAGERVGGTPALRLIRSPRDAEEVAAEWLDHFGLGPCRVTPIGSDEGVDVYSTQVVAQVKMEALPVGRPVIQQIAGVGAVEGKRTACFALAGFTAQAIEWANRAQVALFQFDLQGEPKPVNEAVRHLSRQAGGNA